MISNRPSRLSKLYGRMSSACRAILNRSNHLWRRLHNRRDFKKILKSSFFGVVGAALYEFSAQSLFGVSLHRGVAALIDLERPLFYWGSILLLSIIIGGWSVAEALWYSVVLTSRWAKLRPAGVR